MMICLSDLHIGATYDSMFGKYNSDIAKERLDEYLQKIELIRETNCISKAFVVGLGDLVSGNIHYTIAVTNRENVIQQVIKASELVSDFYINLHICLTMFVLRMFLEIIQELLLRKMIQ